MPRRVVDSAHFVVEIFLVPGCPPWRASGYLFALSLCFLDIPRHYICTLKQTLNVMPQLCAANLARVGEKLNELENYLRTSAHN